jgi:hypothetical protein
VDEDVTKSGENAAKGIDHATETVNGVEGIVGNVLAQGSKK